MRIIGLLSWYDEDPGMLSELVAGMARAGVDHVVAVDGAYALFPRGKGGSHTEQAAAVFYTARGAGMGVTIHVPRTPWARNECQKRSFMFAAGHLTADPGTDWLWVCDADEVIEESGDVRYELAQTDLDVAEVLLEEDGGHMPIRKLFRAQEHGIRVQGTHSTYLGDSDVPLWAPDGPQQAAEQLFDVRVRHRPNARSVDRELAQDTYYRVRDDVGAEGHAVRSP